MISISAHRTHVRQFCFGNVTALGVFLILGGETKYSTNGIKAKCHPNLN